MGNFIKLADSLDRLSEKLAADEKPKYELMTYNRDDSRLDTIYFDDYNKAMDAGYDAIKKHADYFHVSLPDGQGKFLELPNGKTLYVGRWNDQKTPSPAL